MPSIDFKTYIPNLDDAISFYKELETQALWKKLLTQRKFSYKYVFYK